MTAAYTVPFVGVRVSDQGIGGGSAVRAWRRQADHFTGAWMSTSWKVCVEIGPDQYFTAPAMVDDFGTLVLVGALQ